MAKQFDGVGRTKSPRRGNSPAGSKANRKYYPYPTADQVGTPMEKMIYSNYDSLQQQFNDMQSHPNGLQMATNESTGRLNRIWNRYAHKMTHGNAAGKYIEKHGGTVRGAIAKLKDMSGVIRFGADPKKR